MDYERGKAQGKDLGKLVAVLQALLAEAPLPVSFRDHLLKGDWKPHRECHVTPDWLLIYLIKGEEVRLVRTGSHSELFDK